MFDHRMEPVAKGCRAGLALAAVLLYGCGSGARPLHLPSGHPAHPATAGTPRTPDRVPVTGPPAADPHAGHSHPAPQRDAVPATPAVPAPVPETSPRAPVPPAPVPPAPESPVPAPKTYTCPMHPEVVSSEAGRCPKCGMRLREVKPAKKEGEK